MNDEVQNVKLPSSVQEAVDYIIQMYSWIEGGNEFLQQFATENKDDLYKYHHGFGTAIRNNFRLWINNKSLMEDTGTDHPDDASMVIIEALWERLHKV